MLSRMMECHCFLFVSIFSGWRKEKEEKIDTGTSLWKDAEIWNTGNFILLAHLALIKFIIFPRFEWIVQSKQKAQLKLLRWRTFVKILNFSKFKSKNWPKTLKFVKTPELKKNSISLSKSFVSWIPWWTNGNFCKSRLIFPIAERFLTQSNLFSNSRCFLFFLYKNKNRLKKKATRP